MRNRTNGILGAILITLGTLFLLRNFDLFDPFFRIFNFGFLISTFWPALFLIIPGLIFHYGYFAGNKRAPGLLIPGGILLVLGATFQINMLFGAWTVLWPLYIFAFAFGLYEFYLCTRIKGMLIPIGIIGGLSAVFFMTFSINELFGYSARKIVIPVVIILTGFAVIFGGKGLSGNK